MSTTESQTMMQEFLEEGDELIQRLSSDLGAIDRGQGGSEQIGSAYRSIHTLKGSAQLLGYESIGRIAHTLETCLEPLRRGAFKPDRDFMDAVFKCVGVIETMLAALRTKDKTEISPTIVHESILKLVEASCRVSGGALELWKENWPMTDQDKSNAAQGIPRTKVEAGTTIANQHEATTPVHPPKGVSAPQTSEEPSTTENSSTIRVQVGVLDHLMNLVGEIVLVRNQVLQFTNQTEDLDFLKLSQRLDVVTSELQGEVMKTRMQPIGNVVSKFQRVVRDLARELEKEIALHIEGQDTELDKTLLEGIKDPLTHLVRNACDHGLEKPEDRIRVGKPPQGRIQIRALHEGGQVIIEISDDGRGLEKAKIIAKALENGIVTRDRADSMSEQEIFKLVFQPGFSTAEKVTAVSGRGVGMDVVKTNIEKIGGFVELTSVQGKGTTVRLRIPLTLAIVPALLVQAGGEKFAIPQIKLMELVRVELKGAESPIEFLQGKPMYRLRGNLLPIVSLAEILKLRNEAPLEAATEALNIAVLNADGHEFGLVVDEILDSSDIVVKPLNAFLKALTAYSGATITGNGSIALILDVTGLARSAQMHYTTQDSSAGLSGISTGKTSALSDSQEFLLFRLAAPNKFAIPLCLVNRLEEFPAENVEYSGQRRIVRYRESLLPLIELNDFLGFKNPESTVVNPNGISTIVIHWRGRNYGLEVDQILDVIRVDTPVDDLFRDRPGMLGNIIYKDEVESVIDALGIIEQEAGKMSAGAVITPPISQVEAVGVSRKILYAEDSAFFRTQVSRMLERAGYIVHPVRDGQEALQKLEAAPVNEYSAIVTDIEMPRLTGLELGRKVKQLGRWKSLKLVALTTRSAPEDEEMAVNAGFDLYLTKLNEQELLQRLEQTLRRVA